MIGLDSTFLIDLYWKDSPRHLKALDLFNKISESDEEIQIYYNCFNEFVHVITDSRRFEDAFSMKEAMDIVDLWCNLEKVTVIYPDDMSFGRAKIWISMFNLGKNRLNATNMAACYAQNGASKIITANSKDFEIFEVFKLVDYK